MFSKIRFMLYLAVIFSTTALFPQLGAAETTASFNGREYIETNGRWYEVYLGEEWEVADIISINFKEGAAVLQRIANLSDEDWDNQAKAYRIDLGIGGIGGIMMISLKPTTYYGYCDFRIPEGANLLEIAKNFLKSDQVEKAYTTIYLSDRIYVRREGSWYVIYLRDEWRVCDVITVRFKEGATPEILLEEAAKPQGPGRFPIELGDKLGIKGVEGVMLCGYTRNWPFYDFKIPEGADPLQMCRRFLSSDKVETAETNSYGRVDSGPDTATEPATWGKIKIQFK